MSDDLISRKTLVNNLKLFLDRSFLGETTAHNCVSVGEIAGLIKDAPTAYDADKVIEQLEDLKRRYWFTIANTGDEKLDCSYENVGNALDKAIEIVKSGGVVDE